MIYIKFKKIVLCSRLFRFIDLIIRIILNNLLKLLPSNNINVEVDQYIFMPHGGMGDIILQKKIINKLADEKNVLIILDKRMEYLKSIFIGSKILFYKKEDIFNDIKSIKKNISKNSALIHTSPVFEIHLMRFFLGIKASVGLVHSFNEVKKLNGYTYKVDSINKLVIYDELYHQLFYKK